MNDIQRDDLLANCLEDIHRRRALGESPAPEEYRSRLGDSQAEFVDILDASDAIDQAMAPPVEDPLPRAFGRYTLTSELGRGAMGVVYEAFDRDLLRTVAVKVLRTGFDTEPTAVERFRREARLCAQVDHDHIVKIYDHGEIEGRPYYTMSLLHGTTLAALVKAGAPPAPKDLAKGLAGIADGLHLLHTLKADGKSSGIVHRDVKPSNILVEEKSGRYVLCDFGLARNFDSGKFTKTGEAVGTPLYMPPEQMLGKKEDVDARSDVYGLGATMYEALSGQPPFKTDEPSALWGMILTQRPRSLFDLVPGLDPDCEKIVRMALEKRREDRHASAADLRDDLEHFAAGEPIENIPPTWLRLAARGAKRYAPAMAAGVLLAVGGFYLWMHRSATLVFQSDLPAMVAWSGAVHGATPLSHEVSPGKYTVSADFGARYYPRTKTFEVASGDHLTNDFGLPVPKDPKDEIAQEEILQAMSGGQHEPLVQPPGDSRTRSGPRSGEDIVAFFPRGDVMLEDVKGKYRMTAPTEADTDGTIEFHLNGSAEPLYKQSFLPRVDVWEAEIPAAVRAKVNVGDKVTWGFYSSSDKKRKSTATFEVVAAQDVAKKLERFTEKWKDEPPPPTVLALFRAQTFLDHRLYSAALSESLKIRGEQPTNVRANAIAFEALRRLKLSDSDLADDIKVDLGQASPDKKAVVYGKR